MLFEIAHLTRYRYDRPVGLEPTQLRLCPRSDLWQRLVAFDLAVDPVPEGSTELVDVEGNTVTSAWFLGETSHLTLRTSATVETLRPNPFDYVVLDPDAYRVPMRYPVPEASALARYLADPAEPVDPLVAAVARDALAGSAGGPTAFLGELCCGIAATITHEARPTGPARPAGETLRLGTGACRDVAVLFIAACRYAGVAARFVSGYTTADDAPEGPGELHAWAEVYVSGAGWRGYDPTQGLAVADRHVALAAGPGPAEAAPLSGTYRASGVESTLESAISVRVLAPPRPRVAGPGSAGSGPAGTYQSAAISPPARMEGVAPF